MTTSSPITPLRFLREEAEVVVAPLEAEELAIIECPSWCSDHVETTDVSYHNSGDWLVQDQVLVVVGPAVSPSGEERAGVFLFKKDESLPALPLSVEEAQARLLELNEEILQRNEVAAALAQAVQHAREAEPCPIPDAAL